MKCIVLDSKIMAGKPVIKGTRNAVPFIMQLLVQGWREADILRNYPILTTDDIHAARDFTIGSFPSPADSQFFR